MAVVLVAGGLALAGSSAGAAPAPAAGRQLGRAVGDGTAVATVTSAPTIVETWSRSFTGDVAQSSPTPDRLDGAPAAVVGTRGGQVQAFFLSSGRTVPGWPATTPDRQPVDASPSINGTMIYVGTGNSASPTGGGYLALDTRGGRVWYTQRRKTPKSTSPYSGVFASMSVGDLEGSGPSVVAGTQGEYEDQLNASTGAVRTGFPWFSSDTEFSTPAIADIYGNGHNYIIGGAEQTAGVAAGHRYTQGGHLRVLRASGNAGTGQAGGGVVCEYDPNQGVYSSPAVGRFLAGNAIGIVVGTSTDFKTGSDTDKLIATTSHCRVAWKAALDGNTMSSPALVDAMGNGRLQVAEGTRTGKKTGTVYLLDAADGRPDWSTGIGGQVIGGIGSADLGRGYQDLIVPSTGGLYILDGRTGRVVAVLGKGLLAEQNSPLVTDDPDGRIGITIAGYNAKGGMVVHYEVDGTNGALADETGAWPEFHHDPQLTGTTLPRIG